MRGYIYVYIYGVIHTSISVCDHESPRRKVEITAALTGLQLSVSPQTRGPQGKPTHRPPSNMQPNGLLCLWPLCSVHVITYKAWIPYNWRHLPLS